MMTGYSDKTYFDGWCFEDHGIVVERVHDNTPEIRDSMEDRTGGDGALFWGYELGSRTITLECRGIFDTFQGFEDMRDMLAPVLLTKDERPLLTRAHPTQPYMAHLTAFEEGERGTDNGAFTLTFVASDPYRIGGERSLNNVSSTEISFTVGGTADAYDIFISTDAAQRASSSNQIWGVTFDSSMVLHIPISTSGAHSVRIDCAARKATVDGSSVMVTLDSDWPVLSPGTHTLRRDYGSGYFSVKIRERYL